MNRIIKNTMSISAAATILALTACNNTNPASIPNVTVNESSTQSPLESIVQGEMSNSSETSPEQTSSTENAVISTPESTSDDTSYVPPNNDQEGEVSGSILVLEDENGVGRGIMLYGIGYEPGRNYARTVNKYKEELGANVNVYSLIAPTQVSFYLPERYSDLSDSETAHIDDVNENLYGIIPIDAFAALKSHVNEDIYYRTDHHWTQLGAYYAAQAFAKTAQVPFDELSEYDKNEREGYVGTLYGSSNQDPRIGNSPETFFWYVPKRDYTATFYDTDAQNGYEAAFFYDPENFGSTAEWNLTYMIGDGHIVHVNTSQKNGRHLMILKDSYADSFAPCLFGSFEDIWIVDMRYCTTSALQLAKDKGITDLLFCSCTFSATAQNQYKLEEIM